MARRGRWLELGSSISLLRGNVRIGSAEKGWKGGGMDGWMDGWAGREASGENTEQSVGRVRNTGWRRG